MLDLTKILKEATAAIGEGYFRLRIDGGDPVYRERVYCYELYHQMRLLWPTDTQFYLNGEIDKAAHPILSEMGAAFAKPDFLVHQPGYMAGNNAVVEVKSASARATGIRSDLKKLSLFVNTVGYQRAIYLVYGEEAKKTARVIEDIATAIDTIAPIELWLHQKPENSAIQATVLGTPEGPR